jgi:intein/homing endonuclease
MVFNTDKNILVVALKQSVAANLVKKTKIMHDNLPSFLRRKKVRDNRLSMELDNQSQISAETTTENAGRSESLSLLIIDEAAFIDGARDLWASVQATLSQSGGSSVVLSTPENIGNWFHEVWQKAVNGAELIDDTPNKEKWIGEGENGFHPIKLHWSLHPDRDAQWRKEQGEKLPEKEAKREYDCFDGDTHVYTRTGLRPIKNISVGDKVLTAKGNWKPVVKTRSVKKQAFPFHSDFNTKTSYVSDDHRFLNSDRAYEEFKNIADTKYLSAFPKDIDVPVRSNSLDLYSLCENMDTRFSRVLVENDTQFHMSDKHKVIHNRYIDIDYDLGYLVGMYLAEGSGNHRQKTFSFDATNEDEFWVQRIVDIVDEKVGLSKYNLRYQENTGHLLFSSRIFCELIDTFVSGKHAPEKKLTNKAYRLFGMESLKGVLDGVMHGDGMCKPEYSQQLHVTSEGLANDILYISRLLGWERVSKVFRPRSNKGKIEDRVITQNNQWKINFHSTHGLDENTKTSTVDPKNIDYTKGRKLNDDYVLDRILKHPNDSEKKTLYDIEVADDHSFVTEHFVVHNCDFSSSGTTVIEMDRIESIEEHTVSKPKYKVPILAGTSLWVWEEPQPNTNYIISADVARGDDEGDFSTFQVFTTKQIEQVAEYRARIAPDQLGEQIYKVGNIYNQALAVVERNNYGFTTLQRLIDMDYKNLLYTSSDFKIVEVNANVSSKKKVYPGLKTTRKTRPLLVSKLEEFIRKDYATIRSSRLVDELKTFVWKTSKRAEHLDGFYDDLIFATMFAFWSRDTAIRVFGNEKEMNKGMVKGIKNKNSPSKQIPSSGISSGKNRGNPYRDPSSGEDISWLFN